MVLILTLTLAACYSTTPGMTWNEEHQLTRLGLMTPREAEIIANDLVAHFTKVRAYGDWVMEHDRGPLILVGTMQNQSSADSDTERVCSLMEESLAQAIRVSFKGQARSRFGVNIIFPAEAHGRFLNDNERASVLAIQASRCDMVLCGYVQTRIFKKNLAPIRNYYVAVELRDARNLSRVIWRGINDSLNKAVKAGPVRKSFYKRGW